MDEEVKALIEGVKALAERLPTLPEKSDADMALMYLRHVERQLKGKK